MPTARLLIGSRGSQLALWQARHVAHLLAAAGQTAEVTVITTSGDKILHAPLAQFGGKGLFTKEIEDALLSRKVRLAVHSLKDVPAQVATGLTLAAILPREDPRDALVAAPGVTLASLPAQARVGTSSLRRRAQLQALRPDLRIVERRGNVDTRLNKLAQHECDALLLAAAGLIRLGRQAAIAEWLAPEQMCPAVGQGALALECRADDAELRATLAALNDAPTAAAVAAERAVLSALNAGCQTPIAAYAQFAGAQLRLRALVAEPDGRRILRAEQSADLRDCSAEDLGARVADALTRQGADEILAALAASPLPAPEAP